MGLEFPFLKKKERRKKRKLEVESQNGYYNYGVEFVRGKRDDVMMSSELCETV